jgi:hypothetical protein
MNMTFDISLWQIILPIVFAVAGAATAYGMMRNQVRVNKRAIGHLYEDVKKITGDGGEEGPMFVIRRECDVHRMTIGERVDDVKTELQTHGDRLKGIESFARWVLTKEGLPLDKVNEIMNGDH